MTVLKIVRKVIFNANPIDNQTAFLLYDKERLIGYTNNADWIYPHLLPREKKAANIFDRDYILYLVFVYKNTEWVDSYSFQTTENRSRWLSVPANRDYKALFQKPPGYANDGPYTLLEQNRTARQLFEQHLEKTG